MATLKGVLTQQASVPATIESGLPSFLPRISPLMVRFANMLPINPPLPDLPADLTNIPIKAASGIAGIMKGIPMPKMPAKQVAPTQTALGYRSEVALGGYRPVSGAAGVVRPMGGGYRSI